MGTPSISSGKCKTDSNNSGTMVQWYSGTMVQSYSGTVVQWYI